MFKYKVKFKRYTDNYIYVYDRNNSLVFSCLGFSTLVYFFEDNNIDFKDVRFNCSLDDLFYHCIDYDSLERHRKYRSMELKKKEMLKDV